MTETRADRFVRELAELKIADPSSGRGALWLRAGGALMALGLVAAVASYFMAHNTSDALAQRDALAIGLAGIAATIAGSAVYLRFSLTGYLRYWSARQSFDLERFADRLSEKEKL